MAENELHEKIVLEGVEHAESGLQRLSSAVGRVAGAFEGMTEVAGAIGGIGGIWKLAEGFQEASNLYSAVGRISRATGMTAVQAHGMFEAFEQSGVELDAAESVMTSMARMAGKIGGSLSVTAEQSALINRHMQALGVNIKKGPQEQMLAMAEAAQRGKLQMQDLVAVFGVQRTQAERMYLLLKRGPEALRDTFREVASSSGVIDAAALESFAEMKKSRAELKSAWDDLVRTLYKSVIPAVTEILRSIKSGFEAVKPIAETIGSVLAGHMREVVKLTEIWVGLVAANKIANFGAPLLGGKKMSLLGEGEESGRIASLLKGAWGMVSNLKPARAGGMDYFAAKDAFKGAAMFESVGGPLVRVLGSVAGKAGLIGVVITAVIAAFELLRKNVFGVRDWFITMFKNIGSVFAEAFHKIVAVFEKLMEAVKPIAAVLGGALLISLRMFGFWVEWMGHVLNVVMDAIVAVINAVIWALNKLPWVKISRIDLDSKKEAAKRSVERPDAEGKGSQIYQDFRGSKFEIENNFPASVDGGRVAVAFGDEMARLGERRVDSGLRPLYSYR